MLATLNYMYDESGGGLLREREVVGGTKIRFHWEGLNLYLEEEWSGSAWILKRTYINQPSALGGALARFDLGTSNTLVASDSGWFYHYDEAGNVILITDKNGGLIKHFEQDAWGNDLNGSFSTTQNIRQHQTGKYLDEATGLYFFGARWYDPAIGRFISVSPLMPNEEEYAFCGNDPVNRFDGDGLFDEVVDIIYNNQEPLRKYFPDVASGASPEEAKTLIGGIEEGAECLILVASPGPDEVSLISRLIRPVGRFLRKVPLIGRLFNRRLGRNVFYGKTPAQIDKMFREKGFIPRGPNPVAGRGDYFNPITGRRYYIDPGGSYPKGYEYPHVDVFRPETGNKKKFPLGDKLYD